MPIFTICNVSNAILFVPGVGEILPTVTVTKILTLEESICTIPALKKLRGLNYCSYTITDSYKFCNEDIISNPPPNGYKVKNLYVDSSGKLIFEFED